MHCLFGFLARFWSDGLPPGITGGNDRGVVLHLLVKCLELLALALVQVCHPFRTGTLFFPRAHGIGYRALPCLISPGATRAGAATPLGWGDLGQNRFDRGIDGNHGVVHCFAGLLHRLTGKLYSPFQRRILLDCRIMRRLELGALGSTELGHRPMLSRPLAGLSFR